MSRIKIPEITTVELLERYNAGERNFSGVKIIKDFLGATGYELFGVDLRGISLRGAYLEDICFSETNLMGADLSGCCLLNGCLSECILSDARLDCANLDNCSCNKTTFGGCSMQLVNATRANFQGAFSPVFSWSILIETNLKDAVITRQVLDECHNFIYRCIMPDGSYEIGPIVGWER